MTDETYYVHPGLAATIEKEGFQAPPATPKPMMAHPSLGESTITERSVPENAVEHEEQEVHYEEESLPSITEELEPKIASRRNDYEREYEEEEKAHRRFARMREENRRLEQEREYLLSQLQNKKQTYQEEVPQYHIDDDSLLEGKHYKAIQAESAAARKALKEEIEQVRKLSIRSEVRARYNDLDSVLSEANLDWFGREYPENAKALLSHQDYYTQLVGSYKLIKNLLPKPSSTSAFDKQQLAANRAKPRSTSSVAPQRGDTALDQAYSFSQPMTSDVKKKLWEEMQQAARNRV